LITATELVGALAKFLQDIVVDVDGNASLSGLLDDSAPSTFSEIIFLLNSSLFPCAWLCAPRSGEYPPRDSQKPRRGSCPTHPFRWKRSDVLPRKSECRAGGRLSTSGSSSRELSVGARRIAKTARDTTRRRISPVAEHSDSTATVPLHPPFCSSFEVEGSSAEGVYYWRVNPVMSSSLQMNPQPPKVSLTASTSSFSPFSKLR